MGKLLAICTSPQRGTVKTEVESARLTPEWGIETDAHGGNWHRQVSLLSAEKIENFRKKIWVDYGAFGENLVVEGYDFRNLPVTSRFAIGDVVLEMTQIGKECHNDCVIKQQTGECIMPREGVFARVLKGGEIHVGDEVPVVGDSFKYPEYFDILSVEDGAAILIRDGKVEDIQKIEEYRYMGLPVVDERGMELLVKNKEELGKFLSEAKEVTSENRSEVHNKWFRFETYRKVVCTDNFWVI